MRKNEFFNMCESVGYIIRTNASDLTSYHGFQWPEYGYVAAPDWEPTKSCGFGLHGLLNGEGDCLSEYGGDDKMIVAAIDESKVVNLDGKVKFEDAFVLFAGDPVDAWAFLHKLVGNKQMYNAILTAGDESTLTAGDESTLTAGDWSTLTAGDRSTLTAGDRSTLTAGYRSTLTAGDESTLTAGDRSTLTAGYWSTLIWKYWDGKRYRLHTEYVGENGIEPNVAYVGRFIDGEFVVVEVQ